MTITKETIIKAIENNGFIFYKTHYNGELIYIQDIANNITIRINLDPNTLDIAFKITQPFDRMAGGIISKNHNLRFKTLSKINVSLSSLIHAKIQVLLKQLSEKILNF